MMDSARFAYQRLRRHLCRERTSVESRQSRFERAFITLRYILASLALLAGLVAGRNWFVLAGDVAVGNTILAWLVSRDTHRTCWLAMILEWQAAMLLLWVAVPTVSSSPSLFIIVIVLAGLRDSFRGLLCSTLASTLGFATLVLVRFPDQASHLLGVWLPFMALSAVIGGIAFHADQRSSTQHAVDQRHERQLMRQWETGLSHREREVLALLPEEDLTYEGIGDRLSISPETVKTHVHRMGRKLAVHGRWAVVAVARERGLLPENQAENDDA